MKKVLLFVLTLALCFGLVACGSSSDSKDSDSKEETKKEESAEESKEEPEEKVSDEPQWEMGTSTVKTWTNSIGTQWVQMISPITNTGDVNLYLSACKIDLEDEAGHLVDSKDMISVFPQVLQPGETGYYYEETILEDVEATGLKALPHESAEKASVECIRLDVTDLDIKADSYDEISITGRVENNTEEAQSSVYVVAFLYGADGNLIGIAYDIFMDEIAPGDKMGFSASAFSLPDDVTIDAVASYSVVAYPFQYQFW